MRRLTALAVLAALAIGCTTLEKDVGMQRQAAPDPVEDDRPMPAWNRLLGETLPVVRRALERGSESFHPRAFVLSRRGGVRSIHISPRAGANHEERLELIFSSIRVMMSGDELVAFVVYATGRGNLLNSSDRSNMVVAHMEHYTGRAVLRRIAYSTQGEELSFGKEDVESTEALIMAGSGER